MRIRWLPLIVAALALAALIVHLTMPFAHVVQQDGTGAVASDETYGLGEYQDMRAAADSSVVPPSAGFTHMLVGLGILAVGAVVFAVAAQAKGRVAEWTQFGAGLMTAGGAIDVILTQGMWVGRGFASLIQKTMGWDNPPTQWEPFIDAYSSADLATYTTVISPILVLAAALAATGLLLRAWAGLVRLDRGMQAQARQHGRMAFVAAAVLAALLVVPWVVTVAAGSVQPANTEVPDDTFFWSAYDVAWFKSISYSAADERGEVGIILWYELGSLLGAVLLTAQLAVYAAVAGIAGKHLESIGQPVFGRLLENVSLANVLLMPFVILAGILASFFLLDPNDLESGKRTGVALLASAAGIVGTVFALLNARGVLADETGLVADDFPEPVVYD